MKYNFFMLTLAGTICLSAVKSERVINTPIVTTFGDWQDWEYCPEGSYVTAMDLTTEELATPRGVKDKTGIISAVFQCSFPATANIAEGFIFSNVKGVRNSVVNSSSLERNKITCEGDCEVVYRLPLRASCEGIVIGVEVMNYEKQLALDNTGASNLRVYCSEMAEEEVGYVEGYGIYDGDWTSPVSCGARKGICGMQTLSQDLKKGRLGKSNNMQYFPISRMFITIIVIADFDESAVNAFRFKCCDIPNPADTCQPKEEWELIQECSNSGNSTPAFTCAYVRRTGVSNLATGVSVDSSVRTFYNTIGFDLDSSNHLMFNSLKNNFANVLSKSALSTALDWSATGLEIWVEEQAEDVTFYSIPTSKSVQIYQLIGSCDYFSVRTPIIKQVSA